MNHDNLTNTLAISGGDSGITGGMGNLFAEKVQVMLPTPLPGQSTLYRRRTLTPDEAMSLPDGTPHRSMYCVCPVCDNGPGRCRPCSNTGKVLRDCVLMPNGEYAIFPDLRGTEWDDECDDWDEG